MSDLMAYAWLLVPVALASTMVTGLLRRYALARSLLDVPNARSSHSVPTPRGGGVAIVVSLLLVLPVLQNGGLLPGSQMWAILGAGSFTAILGFLDDHSHIAARWRLIGHVAAAVWALFWLGGMPSLDVFVWTLGPGWFGTLLGLGYLVWMLNLYNFMDGIDGIASVEAICVCLGGAALYVLSGRPELGILPLVLAGAVAGFLFWNFPPARIFMGDAGSGFLGIVLGILSLQAAGVEPALFWGWMILLGVFVVDATFTLFQRLLRRERVYEAHRTHAYQHAAVRFGRHLPVTAGVVVLNLFWLMPIALYVGSGGLNGVLGTLIAYLPLVVLAGYFRAGKASR